MNNNPFDVLNVNLPMCDWLTFTSWRMDGFNLLRETVFTSDVAQEKRLNYTGDRCGSVFIGDGVQNGHWHKILQVSGAAADDVIELVLNEEHSWICTQMDLQITCEWHDAPLFDLCAELVRIHGDKKPSYTSSAKNATVYFGAWTSDRLVRIYPKSHRLVRFEVKYKKAYSDHMARVMKGELEPFRRDYMKAWLRWELDRLNSPMLNHVFRDSLSVEPIMPVREVSREESDRERWLRKVVCPVLDKYAHSHDRDPNLLDFIGKLVDFRSFDNELQK